MQSIIRKGVLRSVISMYIASNIHLICCVFHFGISFVRICNSVSYCQGHKNISNFFAGLQGVGMVILFQYLYTKDECHHDHADIECEVSLAGLKTDVCFCMLNGDQAAQEKKAES